MPNTYGFDGSEPARDVPSRDGDGVSTRDGTDGNPLFTNLDGMFTGNVAGVSPVSGLGVTPDFEEAITGAGIGYVGNTASTGTGMSGTLGSIPIPGSKLNPPSSTATPHDI